MTGKRKDDLDDTPSLVEIIDGNLTDMQTAAAAGDHAAVDRIYNRMVLIMDAAAWARTADPDAALYTVRGVGSGGRDVDTWRANDCTPRIGGSKYQ
jgi:hypothetical protein